MVPQCLPHGDLQGTETDIILRLCILRPSLSFHPGYQDFPDASEMHIPFTELRTGSLFQCILVRLGSKVFACSP